MDLCAEDHAETTALEHVEDQDDFDDEFEEDAVDDHPVVRIIVPAIDCKPLRTNALRSVFDAGSAANGFHLLSMGRRLSLAPAPDEDGERPRFIQCQRDSGTTRCFGGQYPSDRWTPEKEEKERQRRARQIVPRPPKGARSKGKKLRDLVGNDDW